MTASAMVERGRRTEGFRHEALLYSSAAEFIDGTVPFIREGLDGDERILVVLSTAKIDMLRAELGGNADRVSFLDMEQVGVNPARIIPAWREFADACAALGGPFRGIGEPIWPERDVDELVECQRHEALLNLAFANAAGFRLLCPYDTSALPSDVVDEAFRSHPVVVEGQLERASTVYDQLDDVAVPFSQPLRPPVGPFEEREVDAGQLGSLRRFVELIARAAGLAEARIDDLVVAVNELTSNTVRHGGGHGTLRVWCEGRALICEVSDGGLIADPMAGRVQPADGSEGGRGLWIVTQLCDLVQVRTFDTGSVVRLHVHLDA